MSKFRRSTCSSMCIVSVSKCDSRTQLHTHAYYDFNISGILFRKFGLYYLVGSKEAKSDEFSEMGVPFWNLAPPKPFGPLQTPFLDPPMLKTRKGQTLPFSSIGRPWPPPCYLAGSTGAIDCNATRHSTILFQIWHRRRPLEFGFLWKISFF